MLTTQHSIGTFLLVLIIATGLADENSTTEFFINANTSCYINGNKWVELVESWNTDIAGKCLMSLPLGMNSMELDTDVSNNLLVGIHGFKSSGSEWITPLLTLNRDDLDIFFFVGMNIESRYIRVKHLYLS